MRISKVAAMLAILFCLFIAPQYACGQSLAAGVQPFGSYQPGGFDSINRQNLNVFFTIPIVHSPGRGMNFDYALVYNSSFWAKSGGAWYPSGGASGYPAWGWWQTKVLGSVTFSTSSASCHWFNDGTQSWQWEYATHYYGFQFTDASGAVHHFNLLSYYSTATDCGFDPVGPYASTASDSSGISYDASTGIVTFPDGTAQVGGSVVDSNGNQLTPVTTGSETDWTDTAGRTPLKVIVGSTSTAYEYLDPTGAYQTTTVKYQTYNVLTNFGCTGVTEYSDSTPSLPYEIDLPNGQKYLFDYEATPSNPGYTTGRLHKVTLPTGGYYQYEYTGSYDGTNCADGTALNMTVTINDGTNSPQWIYARTAVSGHAGTTTVTAPQLPYDSAANQSVYTFNSSGQQTQAQLYQGSASSGTLLRTGATTWATNGTPATQVTTLDTGQQSEVDTTYGTVHQLTQAKEYDLGASAPGSLVRETDMTYANDVYGWRLTQKLIKNPVGTVVYREDRAYDGATPTCVTGVTQHDDSHFGCSYNTRGNLTSITTYTSPATPSGGVTTSFTYNTLGNLLTTSVGGTLQTQYSYSSTSKYASPDSVVSGPSGSGNPQLTTSATYNACTGQVATSTDANGQVTSFSYDVYKRPTSVTRPDTTQLTASYDDTNLIVTSTTPVDSSHSTKKIVAYDGLGRPGTTKLEDGSSTVYSVVQTQYDLLGRAYKGSNPYASSASYWTEVHFDGLGRPIKTILPDSAYSTASYSGNCATATDPAGKSRKSCSDGLGRLISVFEDPGTLNYETDYSYNLLNQMTQVTQGSQTRSYTYDALGRLTQSTTPEAGTVCIGTVSSGTCQQNGYNSFDLVTTSTDARGVVTNYSYDTLNRLTQSSYNVSGTGVTGTSTVSYTYGTSSSSNNNGRLTQMNDGTGSESYHYDILGHRTEVDKVVGTTTYTNYYSRNLAGQLTQITYPSGRVVVNSYDAIGRPCAVGTSSSTCSSGTRYASGFNYNTAQEVTNLSYGNGIVANMSYSPDRLQLQCLQYDTVAFDSACTKDSTAKFMLTYAYGSSGSNNGQIAGITDGMDSGRTASYSYDALGRLSAASTSGSSAYPAWGLTWTYDRYGNRTAQSIASGCTGVTCPTNSVGVSTSTNRITDTGYSYDSSGNMANDGYNSLTSDAAAQLISASNGSSSGTYAYDGKGLRVKKCVPNCTSPTTTTVYIFSGSRVVSEYDNGAGVTSPSREYIYSGGKMIAKIAGSTTTYYHQDHLSTRLVTDSSGNVIEQLGHFPYGEPWYDTGNEKWKFTTYERDSESLNDYAQARYGVNRLGRFSSPDPLSGSLGNPQGFNRYGYSKNDPINRIDPSGAFDMCGAYGCCDSVVLFDPVCPGQFDPTRPRGGGENGANGTPNFSGGDIEGTPLAPPGVLASALAPNPTGSCIYLNNAGDGVESVDTNSSVDECQISGGYYGPGQINEASITVDPDGGLTYLDSAVSFTGIGVSNGGYFETAVAPGFMTSQFYPTTQVLTQSQCNEMNRGLYWMNQASTLTGAMMGGLSPGSLALKLTGSILGGPTAGMTTAEANRYINEKLCGGPSRF
jgi:RHS repeat-associated protein